MALPGGIAPLDPFADDGRPPAGHANHHTHIFRQIDSVRFNAKNKMINQGMRNRRRNVKEPLAGVNTGLQLKAWDEQDRQKNIMQAIKDGTVYVGARVLMEQVADGMFGPAASGVIVDQVAKNGDDADFGYRWLIEVDGDHNGFGSARGKVGDPGEGD